MKSALHIHDKRKFPRFARAFIPDRRLARDPRRRRDRRPSLPDAATEVFLWADTFNNYFHPSTMRAAHQVLTSAGFRVTLPAQASLLRPASLRLWHAGHREGVSAEDPRRA